MKREDFGSEFILGGATSSYQIEGAVMDNFEWSQGYRMRYGITHADFQTQRRTPKASAHYFRGICRK